MNFYEYAEQRLAPSNPAVDMLFSLVNSLVVLARFANTSLFLLQGKYPNLNERFLGLKQEYVENSAQRFYDGKYMTRELLWNGLIVRIMILKFCRYVFVTFVLSGNIGVRFAIGQLPQGGEVGEELESVPEESVCSVLRQSCNF